MKKVSSALYKNCLWAVFPKLVQDTFPSQHVAAGCADFCISAKKSTLIILRTSSTELLLIPVLFPVQDLLHRPLGVGRVVPILLLT